MIIRTSSERVNFHKFLKNTWLVNMKGIFSFSETKKDSKNRIKNQQSTEIIQGQFQDQKNIQTMKKTYEQVQVESFKGKSFTNLTQLQKKIIQEGKFDLNHPQIKPKLPSINSIPGLQTTSNITEIDLGNIKIKQKNQVFLSQIDPYNIPQDYDIKFDQEKKLTIVGKKIQKLKKTDQGSTDMVQNSQMPISMAQSFEQKSLGQLSQKYMGQIGYKYQFNRKRSFKQILLAIPIMMFFFSPFFNTLSEVLECIKSIQQIQQEQIKQIRKIKNSRMVYVLLNNKDFNQIIEQK